MGKEEEERMARKREQIREEMVEESVRGYGLKRRGEASNAKAASKAK